MAFYSIIDIVAGSGDVNFVFDFDYISRDHIDVLRNGVSTPFSFLNAFTITLDTPASAGQIIRIQRMTPISEPVVDYANGSVLGEKDLDATAAQALFAAQEISDMHQNMMHKMPDDLPIMWDAEGLPIMDVGEPVEGSDAATKNYVEAAIIGLITGGAAASDTVESETNFGLSADAGAEVLYSRADHTHGSPANPITAHEAASDPHTQYTTAAEVDSSISTHEASADPHTGYQKESEKDAANGYAGLTAGSKIQNNAVTTGSIEDAAVFYSKIQDASASKLLGRGDSGSGDVEEINIGSNLSMTGSTLSASGGSSNVYTAYSSTNSLGATDTVVALSGASFTFTLTTAVGNSGRMVDIVHLGTSLTQVYTIATTSSQTIANSDGTTTSFILYTNGERLKVVSDGSNWVVLQHQANTSWTDAGVITIGATTTAPTKPTTPDYDHVFWKRAGNLAYVRFVFQVSSNAGSAAGSGAYLFTLPAGIAINTAEITPVATLYSTAVMSEALKSAVFGTGVLVIDSSLMDHCHGYAYSTTELQLVRSSASTPTGNTSFAMTGSEFGYYFETTFKAANWRA